MIATLSLAMTRWLVLSYLTLFNFKLSPPIETLPSPDLSKRPGTIFLLRRHLLFPVRGSGYRQRRKGHGHAVIVVGADEHTAAVFVFRCNPVCKPGPFSISLTPILASSVCRARIRSVSLIFKVSSPVNVASWPNAAHTTITVCARSGHSFISKILRKMGFTSLVKCTPPSLNCEVMPKLAMISVITLSPCRLYDVKPGRNSSASSLSAAMEYQ
jgi:hypothetical protein